MLRTADQLKIKGLCEVSSNTGQEDLEFSPPSKKVPIKPNRTIGQPSTSSNNTIFCGNTKNRLVSGAPLNKRQKRFRTSPKFTSTDASVSRTDDDYEEDDLEVR